MALNPPVVFLRGDWETNSTYLKSMSLEDQKLYGFFSGSSIPAQYVGSDPNDLNGSSNVLVIERNNAASPALFVVIGYVGVSAQIYTAEQDASYAKKLTLSKSTRLSAYMIRKYSPASDDDPRISFAVTSSTPGEFTFNDMRLISGGLISILEKWAFSFSNVLSTLFSTGTSILAITISDQGSEALSRNPSYLGSDIENPGVTYITQYRQSLNLWIAEETQIVNTPTFIIWDGIIYACISGDAYIQMGGVFI